MMSCRVVGEVVSAIPVQQLLDGQMAVIHKWGSCSKALGRVVQRYKDDLIVLGEPWGKCYQDITTYARSCLNCFVVVLPPGTKIEVG